MANVPSLNGRFSTRRTRSPVDELHALGCDGRAEDVAAERFASGGVAGARRRGGMQREAAVGGAQTLGDFQAAVGAQPDGLAAAQRGSCRHGDAQAGEASTDNGSPAQSGASAGAASWIARASAFPGPGSTPRAPELYCRAANPRSTRQTRREGGVHNEGGGVHKAVAGGKTSSNTVRRTSTGFRRSIA